MSDRDELIAKARELSAAATPGPWRCIGDHGHFYVLAKAGDREKLIAETDARDRDTAMGDAVMTAAARTLLPALADLAESEGRRADDLDAEKRSMREILSELHKMLTRATDAGP